MEWLKIVAKDHKEWVKLVQSFGEDFFSEDIVQESYIRLYKYCKPENIIQNGQVNKGFMYFVLRNLYLLHIKSEKKNALVSLSGLVVLKDETTNLTKEEAYSKMLSKVHEEVDSWHWYDKQLFTIYKDTDLSIRDIAKETTISSSSIFNTLKNCKSKIKTKFKEDYEDFKNEDYELIK
jgi:DNA-directed RNA polymerase specialized sigma24 family protein